MEFITNYWSQLTVILGLIGYILKSIFDYRIKNKELRTKYFYELKASKLIDLHSIIVKIQMLIDRRKGGIGKEFEKNVFEKRIQLDKHFWESQFYFDSKTQKSFQLFLDYLKYFENENFMLENPETEFQFNQITQALLKEFKNEIL